MLRDNGDVVYSIVWSLAIANILGAGICLLLARHIAKITTIPYLIIAPFMIGLIFFASFQATRVWGDLFALMALGTLGVYLKRFGWSRPALLIGFVLAPQIEANVYRTSAIYGFEMFLRPVVIVFILLTAISVISVIRSRARAKHSNTLEHSAPNTRPQKLFFLLVLLFAVYLLIDGFSYNFLTGTFQIVSAGVSLAFLLPLGFMLFARAETNCHFDEDCTAANQTVPKDSVEHYLLVFVGFLVLSGVFGFLIGTGVFIATFLILKAKIRLHIAAMAGAAFTVFLLLLASQLNLEYPAGIANRAFPFWP